MGHRNTGLECPRRWMPAPTCKVLQALRRGPWLCRGMSRRSSLHIVTFPLDHKVCVSPSLGFCWRWYLRSLDPGWKKHWQTKLWSMCKCMTPARDGSDFFFFTSTYQAVHNAVIVLKLQIFTKTFGSLGHLRIRHCERRALPITPTLGYTHTL